MLLIRFQSFLGGEPIHHLLREIPPRFRAIDAPAAKHPLEIAHRAGEIAGWNGGDVNEVGHFLILAPEACEAAFGVLGTCDAIQPAIVATRGARDQHSAGIR